MYYDLDMIAVFSEGSINVMYRIGKYLKELIHHLIFPTCNLQKSCDLWEKCGRN